jgi:hypothetical protein
MQEMSKSRSSLENNEDVPHSSRPGEEQGSFLPFDGLKSTVGVRSMGELRMSRSSAWNILSGQHSNKVAPAAAQNNESSVMRAKGLLWAAAKGHKLAQRARGQTDSIKLLTEFLSKSGSGLEFTLHRKTKREMDGEQVQVATPCPRVETRFKRMHCCRLLSGWLLASRLKRSIAESV